MASSHGTQPSDVRTISPPHETTTATEVPTSSRFSFLNFPTELRLMIYRHLFESISEDLAALGVTCKEVEPTGLLQSCHLIR